MAKSSKIRLYVTAPLGAKERVLLSSEDSHYLINVMRQTEGDEIALFNGSDGEWRAEITEAHKKKAVLATLEQLRPQTRGLDLWLLFAPIKRAPVDFLAQKATELGVSVLVPVLTDYSDVKRIKIERLAANAKEAAEQCQRLMVPEVRPLRSLKETLRAWPADRHLMFCDEAGAGDDPLEALKKSGAAKGGGSWAILVGPEGGFSPEERQLILREPYVVPVSLGPRLLRADTAAVSALTVWQLALGDW